MTTTPRVHLTAQPGAPTNVAPDPPPPDQLAETITEFRQTHRAGGLNRLEYRRYDSVGIALQLMARQRLDPTEPPPDQPIQPHDPPSKINCAVITAVEADSASHDTPKCHCSTGWPS